MGGKSKKANRCANSCRHVTEALKTRRRKDLPTVRPTDGQTHECDRRIGKRNSAVKKLTRILLEREQRRSRKRGFEGAMIAIQSDELIERS